MKFVLYAIAAAALSACGKTPPSISTPPPPVRPLPRQIAVITPPAGQNITDVLNAWKRKHPEQVVGMAAVPENPSGIRSVILTTVAEQKPWQVFISVPSLADLPEHAAVITAVPQYRGGYSGIIYVEDREAETPVIKLEK